MKKLLLILSIFLVGISANASENLLHTILLEGTDDGYNIVLKSDETPIITRSIKSNNNLVLDVKGITTSNSVNAVYRSTSDINGLIVENVSNDELKIYIQAKDIAKSTIMSQAGDSEPVIVSERFPLEKLIWTLAVFGILAVVIKSAKALTDYENSIVIKKDIKDREIELYRNFQRELASMPSINCKIKNAYATNIMPRSRRNYRELARR